MSLRSKISPFEFVFYIVLIVSFYSCVKKEKPEKIEAIANRSITPNLHATDITTLVSDSGITRYRIATPCWNIYDRANQPYWEFPQGIHFERFDNNLKVESNIQSNYAKFLENEKLWELRGNVRMTNVRGQLFETNQLFWNEAKGIFYSDSIIKITDAAHIIKGVGFDSNQNMTDYHIRKINGIFPVENK